MSRDRQKVLLIALLVVLGGLLWYRLGGGSPGNGRAADVERAREALSPGEVVELRLASRDGVEVPINAPSRNLFSYVVARRPPPPPPPPPPPREDREQKPRRPQPPEVDLSFLGSFGPEGRRIAVFLDGEDVVNAKVGEVLKGKFIVDAIGFESVDVKFVGFPDAPSHRLPAGGKRAG
ncbi:MAG: hypothetical protein R2991_14960 [Thermoanaerobaculia bacterium]